MSSVGNMSDRPTPKRLARGFRNILDALGEQTTDRDRNAADYLRRLSDALDPGGQERPDLDQPNHRSDEDESK